MKRVLITGASGFLGYHLTAAFSQNNWQVLGTFYTRPIENGYRINLIDQAAARALVTKLKPTAVIHTAAMANANVCEEEPVDSSRINIAASVNLAAICKDLDIPYFFCSTDLVFDGSEGFYGPQETPHPINEYGRQKAEAEKQILEVYPKATVCRLPLMYGESGEHGISFIDDFLLKWEKGETVKLFTDEYRTAADAYSVSLGIKLLLEQNQTGIWHLGGKERLSRYEFGEKLAKVFGFENPAIEPVTHSMFTMAAPRPKDVSLNSLAAYKAGYCPSLTEYALEKIKSDTLLGN